MLIVNLFAGPGAGKSTLAAATFASLKASGVCAELVTEFAKDCVWEGREGPLRCQPYVFGEQLWRLERLRGRGVEVAVTDSPILLAALYGRGSVPPSFANLVVDYALRERPLNVRVRRVKPYDPRGRLQTEEEARKLDDEIDRLVDAAGGRFDLTVYGDPGWAATIAAAAIKELGR